MAVPQRTLNWLYSVLSKDHYDPKQTYHDPNRAYHDVANALAQYPTLSPRTDVYTYENGFSALLLHLVGTLPVAFRGTTYRFPIALWIPNTYPHEPPMIYVTPTQDMAVRVGQHVTLEGRVYHHYLAHWAEAWDRSTISDMLSILREVFAKEPPVRYRQPMPPQPQPQQTQTPPPPPPPVPPLPPGMGPSTAQSQSPARTQSLDLATNTPPQLPPKIGAGTEPQPPPARTTERYQSPAPLPPLPPKGHEASRSSISRHMGITSPGGRTSQQFVAAQPPIQSHMQQDPAAYSRTPAGPISPVASFDPPAAFLHQAEPPSGSPLPLRQGTFVQPTPQAPPSQHPGYQPSSPQHQQQPRQPQGPPYPEHSPYPQNYPRPPPAVPAPKKEAPDLLTSPFELELPSFTSAGPAPPIPPNPEKDALLFAVSQTLAETLHGHAAQSDTAAQSLVSQSRSLEAAMATLQGEATALTSLHATLQSNTAILQQSIHRADATIADAQARSASVSSSLAADSPSGLPPIDEVLVAPTVVGKQLYDLVADEQGLQHALYALQSALVRGVIGVDSWSRHTRGLAREAFLKRALIRKIGRGMGLDEAAV
ncbi:Ubiquitin E2 variant N-terminal [Penicillium canariense]|uniref:Ubiquitin E2 variant N-terminal n=1 Tax=Penicillium canariense TaxID=189055 RepID=A0A9W9LG82_9EURO|nr:Ubiquitin E2 variant N-terminal [Penicillium canariense]KAJ5153519.1 Ubiquitin E2 variant N-terminal [Penicillium canariense]